MSGFRSDEVAREALRGVVARRMGTISIILFSLLVGAGISFWSGYETSAANAAWLSSHYAGADSFSVRATSDYPIDSSSCERLRGVEGIEAAGGIISVTELSPEQEPSRTVRLISGSPGLAGVAYPADGLDGASVVVAGALAQDLGLRPGGSLALRSDAGVSARLAGAAVSNHPSMLPGVNGSILVADNTLGTVTECVVTAEPGARDAVAGVLRDWFSQPGVKIVSYLAQDDLRQDPVRELQTRASSLAPIGGGVILIASVLIATWARRGEAALYRILGLKWFGFLKLRSAEAAILVWVPTALGALIAVSVLQGGMPLVVASSLLRDWLTLLFVLLPLPVLMAVVSFSQSPVDVAKGA